MTPRATIAVVSWNTRDLLDGCLSSLRPDADDGLVEVWVHDNASDDGSAAMVRERHPWVTLIECHENIGFGTAVNRVAERTDTEWIAAANSDIRITPGAIKRLLDAGASDQRAGMLAPRLVLPGGATQESLGAFQTATRAVLSFSRIGRLSRRVAERVDPYLDQETARRVEWAAGAFVLVRREAFQAVGGFDESQWMYAEDLDLCWRLARAGWHTLYEPDATVHHDHSAAADKAFGTGVQQRQHDATWSWSVRRLGVLQTALIASLELIEACIRLLGCVGRRRDTAGALGQIRFALTGLRFARGAVGRRARRRV